MSAIGAISFPCVEVKQPIGTFYIGVMAAADLVAISYADVRRIEDRDVEVLAGIQRPLSQSRVKELVDYVNTIDAAFPTSIILAVSSEHASFDPNASRMSVTRDDRIAKIIDGQHRIAGLKDYSGPEFQLNVTIFVDMDLEDQALLFATINLKQTKVNKSLAYDLYEFASTRSPQKTCHNIAKLLNHREGSPFKDKIKILGTATGKPNETLTQATFVDRLIGYISQSPMKDRDLIKRSRALKRATADEEKWYIFRNMFIDEKDGEIARVVWNYFEAVEKRWPDAWPTRQEGLVLNRTTGFGALMRFLPTIYTHLGKPGEVVSARRFLDVLMRVQLQDQDFTSERFKPGTSGEAELYRQLLEQSQLAPA